ncbi:MAG: acyl-CoA dehydrogenase family protein [Thermoanaerobaculia bacterium]|nr:acyl-CoA dehydrogenase family protein [Thermoanaerobaculia bacterium]
MSPETEATAAGLSFELSEEQMLLQSELRRFAEERIHPGEAERDRTKTFPEDLVAEMAELGLLGMFVPEEYGGAGFDLVSYCLAVEEISRISPSLGVTMSVTNSVACWPILRFGSEELKRRVLPELATGETLGGFGLTEPGAGSDAAGLRTRARREGEEWILDGEKAWITNAGYARYFVVVARTDPDAGSRGLTAFVVPEDAPGFRVGEPEHKLGLRASRTAPLELSQCRIPAENLLGEEGRGFEIAMATLDHSRLGIAAQSVGIHRRALELARDYAREREQFGRPIADFQAIQFKLAEMATELEAARTLTLSAASLAGTVSGREAGRLASEAKLFASEAANRACAASLQIHGGNGFHDDYEISRLYRDVRVTTIYEGTSEMQRMVIARRV